MNEDDIIKDDALEDELPEDIKDVKKGSDILDEETESVEDLADDELVVDKDDLMDDVEQM